MHLKRKKLYNVSRSRTALKTVVVKIEKLKNRTLLCAISGREERERVAKAYLTKPSAPDVCGLRMQRKKRNAHDSTANVQLYPSISIAPFIYLFPDEEASSDDDDEILGSQLWVPQATSNPCEFSSIGKSCESFAGSLRALSRDGAAHSLQRTARD